MSRIPRKIKSLFWIAVVLGIIVLTWAGLSIAYPETNTLRYLPDRVFRIVKTLMGIDPLGSKVEPLDVPWQLIAAKVLLTLLLVRALFGVVERVFHEQWTQLRLLLRRGHTIVVGAGRKGSHLLRDQRLHGGRGGVAIESDTANPRIAELRRQGHLLLLGDATEAAALKDAGALRARHVICFGNDEKTGVQVAAQLRQLYAQRRSVNPLDCHVHLDNPRLAALFAGARQVTEAGPTGLRLHFFNLHQMVARHFFARLPQHWAAQLAQPDGRFIFVLLGFGPAAQALLLQGLRVLHLRPDQRVQWHVLAPGVEFQARLFADQYPQASQVADIQFIEFDGRYAHMAQQVLDPLLTGAQAAHTHLMVICAGEDGAANLHAAAELLRATPAHHFPVQVRDSGGSSLPALLAACGPQRLHFFGQIEDFCTQELICGEQQDRLAKAIHADYLQQLGKAPAPGPHESAAYQRHWDALDEDARDANRAQADHIAYKLALAGQLDRAAQGQAPQFGFDMVQALAQAEHARWAAHRYLSGWTYGPVRDDNARQHPSLQPWDALSEAEQQKDRDTVLRLPALLAQAAMVGTQPPQRGTDSA